jgi:shikimate dehydrogenase
MKTFGVIGYPLSHSFSRKYFTEKFAKENITDCEFKNFPLQNISDFAALLDSNPSLRGLSVTIPLKQSIIHFLDQVDETAGEIGAVNCIRIFENEIGKGKTAGFNTDVTGFEKSLLPLLKKHHSKALILGTGGASKAVAFVLSKLKIDFLFLSRVKSQASKILTYSQLDRQIISEFPLIINTTPLGMFPAVDDCPTIPYEFLTDKHLLYDLIYNPEETLFLKRGKEKGTLTKNGLEMLQLQAEKAWEIWNC